MRRLPVLLLLLLSCSRGPTLPPGLRVPVGTWGAKNAGLIVSETDAHVHVGCTNGYFAAPIAVDSEARFTVTGSYILRAYPVMIGPPLPAEFSGTVDGNRLTLRVVVNDTVEKKIVNIGPVTVTLGVEPQMGPCPICRTPAQRQGMK